MNWKPPKDEHIIYEALSAIADGRFQLIEGSNADQTNKAKCTSTSGNKFYEIEFDPKNNAIMSNDNMAYYRDEVSYPMVAMLFALGTIKYDHSLLEYFQGIKWKDINQRNKNDYMKSVTEVLSSLEQEKGADVERIKKEIDKIFTEVEKLQLGKLGKKKVPPKAY